MVDISFSRGSKNINLPWLRDLIRITGWIGGFLSRVANDFYHEYSHQVEVQDDCHRFFEASWIENLDHRCFREMHSVCVPSGMCPYRDIASCPGSA